MTSVLNFPDWFVKVFVLFAFDYAYMGKPTLSLYYFDLHTPSLRRLRNYGCSGFVVVVEVRGKMFSKWRRELFRIFLWSLDEGWKVGRLFLGYGLKNDETLAFSSVYQNKWCPANTPLLALVSLLSLKSCSLTSVVWENKKVGCERLWLWRPT